MRNAAVYILIRFASQGAVFLATLIVARLLPIEAFAAIGAALLLQAVLMPLSGLSLHGALERFYYSYDEVERAGKIFTIWVVSITVNAVFAGLAFAAIAVLHINFLEPWQAATVLLATVLQSSQYVPSVVMRCREDMKVFASMQLAFVILTQFAIVVWILFNRSVDAWFYGTLTGSIAGFAMWAAWVLQATSGRRFFGIGQEIKYILPVLPIGILEAVQQTADRYVLQATVSGAHFATYSLAQRFSSPIATLSSGAKSAIYPVLYRSETHEEAGQLLAKTTSVSIAAFGALTCLAAAALAFVIQFYLSSSYAVVYPFFLVLAAGLFIRGQEVLLGVGPDITMQQGKKLRLLAPLLLLQIFVAAMLTFLFGIFGAAFGFLANSVIRTCAMAYLGQKILPRVIDRFEYWVATIMPLIALGVIGLGSIDFAPVGFELFAAAAPIVYLMYCLRRAT